MSTLGSIVGSLFVAGVLAGAPCTATAADLYIKGIELPNVNLYAGPEGRAGKRRVSRDQFRPLLNGHHIPILRSQGKRHQIEWHGEKLWIDSLSVSTTAKVKVRKGCVEFAPQGNVMRGMGECP